MAIGDFIILDAARMSQSLDDAKKMNPSFQSLHLNSENDLVQSVAPYLFQFERESNLNNYFIQQGWGDSWGILITSKASFTEIHKHFRRFLKVKTSDGLELFFRFYDPRVLRVFLPSCEKDQLNEFFGPVQSFLVEDEDLRYGIKFWLQNGVLQTQKIHFREISISSDAQSKVNAENSDKNETIKEEESLMYSKNIEITEQSNFEYYQNIKPSKPKWDMFD